MLGGRTHVHPDDIKAIAHPVLRHRILTNFSAEADGVTTDDLIDRLLESVAVDGASDVGAAGVLR